MKKVIAIAVAGVIGAAGLMITNSAADNRTVLKVANWAEYIDVGDAEEGTISLITEFENWYKEQTGKEIRVGAGSTDANSALAIGVPAVTIGAIIGAGSHTRGEWIETDSLRIGQQIALASVMQYFD
jgi:acetylornithine deacetylase/succinyl-diaminopimelate desuccinylase-like protein